MIHEVSMGKNGSKLRGVNGITRALSDSRRTYAELSVDYDPDFFQPATRLFTATVPVCFQLHINELVELYTTPKQAGYNDLHRILKLLAQWELLEFCVDVHMTDGWIIRLDKTDLAKKHIAIGIGLPQGGAFRVQALETCRCFIIGRHQENGQLFMTDSMREYISFGLNPF